MKTLELNQMESVQGGSALGCAAGVLGIVSVWGVAVVNPALALSIAATGEGFLLMASITAQGLDLMDKHC